jgi:hypothetical protein
VFDHENLDVYRVSLGEVYVPYETSDFEYECDKDHP